MFSQQNIPFNSRQGFPLLTSVPHKTVNLLNGTIKSHPLTVLGCIWQQMMSHASLTQHLDGFGYNVKVTITIPITLPTQDQLDEFTDSYKKWASHHTTDAAPRMKMTTRYINAEVTGFFRIFRHRKITTTNSHGVTETLPVSDQCVVEIHNQSPSTLYVGKYFGYEYEGTNKITHPAYEWWGKWRSRILRHLIEKDHITLM